MNYKDIKNIQTAQELGEKIALKSDEIKEIESLIKLFPMSIPDYYISLIDEPYRKDPIAKMCIPSSDEKIISGSFDTSGEYENTIMPGLQHKYSMTALILSTNKCAMYCRHCFRKRMVGIEKMEEDINIEQVINYIKTHDEINNVLISGGDAFLLGPNILNKYLEELSKIEHLDFIRVGTRIPVVCPQLLDSNSPIIETLRKFTKRKRIYVITQFNHPKEITNASMRAIKKLQKSDIVVKNQTVLLSGINDNALIIANLMRQLVAIGVVPYYIFQCRPVRGVENQFQVPLIQGYEIVEEAKKNLSGLAKSFRYCMSHPTGKIEIMGKSLNPEGKVEMFFKYHEAKKEEDNGRIFSRYVTEKEKWLML